MVIRILAYSSFLLCLITGFGINVMLTHKMSWEGFCQPHLLEELAQN